MPYAELHCHSDFSFLDGASDPESLIEEAVRLGLDALAIMDELKIKRVNWCGLSMGGMVGQWLGANAPHRINRLIMSNTHSYYADKTVWDDRMALAQQKGMAAAAAPAMTRWFTPEAMAQRPDKVALIQEMFATTNLGGYLACCAAIRNMDMRPTHPRIKAPTLVIVGLRDPATPPAAIRAPSSACGPSGSTTSTTGPRSPWAATSTSSGPISTPPTPIRARISRSFSQ